MKAKNERAALQLKGVNLLEKAMAEHIKNNFETICDRQCQYVWSDLRLRKCGSCDIIAREKELYYKIKKYEIDILLGEYCGLFKSEIDRNKDRLIINRITLEDKVFKFLSTLSSVKKGLTRKTESRFSKSSGQINNGRFLFLEQKYGYFLFNLENGKFYQIRNYARRDSDTFVVFNIPKLFLFEYGDIFPDCEFDETLVEMRVPISPEDIRQVKSFGEEDFQKVLKKAKEQLYYNDENYSSFFLINIGKISYGYSSNNREGSYEMKHKVAVITDKSGNNITIADKIEAASIHDSFMNIYREESPYNHKYENVFFKIKSTDLIGSTLIAQFYICKNKIYAEPISVLTDDNIIHLK
ncbi:MAG: hypothetical protein LBM93_00135 [Oscillospiraceae bacterium]|jgi:hypothetical protein|nr:hypothetical protein [Oscillospiraceae bacterium]